MPARTPQMHLRRGFSLIEIMVAVGIIVLLVGIAVPVLQLARTTALQAQTRSTLNALDTVEVEFESATGRRIWHLDDTAAQYDLNNGSTGDIAVSRFYDPTIDWGAGGRAIERNFKNATGSSTPSMTRNPDGFPEQYIERFIAVAYTSPASRTAVEAASDRNAWVDTDDDGFAEIVDPWGTPFVYASFVSHSDADNADNFLPQRGTLVEANAGVYVPRAPAPLFASAGPDREWGSVTGTQDERDAAEDNIYSFTTGKEGN